MSCVEIMLYRELTALSFTLTNLFFSITIPVHIYFIIKLQAKPNGEAMNLNRERMTEMKKNKFALVLSIAAIMAIGLSTAAFAASDYNTPAQIVAGLTGKNEDEVIAERQAGKSYGAQANEAGELSAFQGERLTLRERDMEQAVLDGKMTQEEADAYLADRTAHMENCDGMGSGQSAGNENRKGLNNADGTCDGTCDGAENGICDGSGAGTCTGSCDGSRSGQGDGTCDGSGSGQGNGTCDGSGSGQGNGTCDGSGSGSRQSNS